VQHSDENGHNYVTKDHHDPTNARNSNYNSAKTRDERKPMHFALLCGHAARPTSSSVFTLRKNREVSAIRDHSAP
jgi:hypothetical protein